MKVSRRSWGHGSLWPDISRHGRRLTRTPILLFFSPTDADAYSIILLFSHHIRSELNERQPAAVRGAHCHASIGTTVTHACHRRH